MASQLLGIKTRFTNDLGSPLVGGQVYTYFAGTSTNQDSYSDSALTVPNTNPVILDDTGSADIFLKGSYRIRVFDKSGRFIEEQDNVTQATSQGDATELSNKLTTLESGLSAANTEINKVKLDTGITATAKFGGVVRSQADVNSDTINAAQFGLVTNSAEDQTLALQNFINYLALNGGYGEVTKSRYEFSDSLVLPPTYAGKSFTIDFKDSEMVINSTANKAPISLIGPKGVILKNATIDGGYSRTGNENHGIAFSNPVDSICENVHVKDYRMSAILFFVNSTGMAATNNNFDNTYRDCHIRNCTSDGKGKSRNGFLLVDLYTSTIDGCNAKGLDRTSSPCVGLQLKNKCRQSMILNSTAEDCLAGVAIGGDGANLGDAGESCLVSNVTVVNCLDGLIASKAVNCDFKNIVIDMVGNPANLVGVNIAGKNSGITVDAVVKNIPSTSKALLMRSSFSYADIKLPTGLHADTVYFASIGDGVQHSNIVVSQMRRGEPSTNLLPLIENLSTFTSNTFKFALSQDSSGITGDSYHYFSTPHSGQSYLAYGGSTKTYTFKAGGDNLLFIRNNGLAPFNDGIMALGGSGRRFSALYAASSTIITSDERLKTKILRSNEAEKRAALKIKAAIGKYQFKDAVGKKGNKARYHYGVGAQTVEKILRDEGLNPFDYAFLCYDEWDADDGIEAGEGYSIRYDELSMFIMAAT